MSEEEAIRQCAPVIQHIEKVWCDGDTSSEKYGAKHVTGWMAHLVQKPWIKMAAAIVVLRGDARAAAKASWLSRC